MEPERNKEANCSTIEEYSLSNQIVRVFKPKVILFTFLGTLVPLNWEDICLENYVRNNLLEFLKENWSTSTVSNLIEKLRYQSFDQHFVFENTNIPLILSYDIDYSNWMIVLHSVQQFVLWYIDNIKVLPENVFMLIKLCWVDGFQRKKIQTLIFDDVKQVLEKWKSKGIKLGIFTPFDKNTCRLFLSSTSVGDLTEHFDHYINPNITNNQIVKSIFDNDSLINYLQVNKKDILIISHYGQDIKLACKNNFQGIIIVRKCNQIKTPIRSYYLIRFPCTTNLNNVDFVDNN